MKGLDELLSEYQKEPVVERSNSVPSNPMVSVIVLTYRHVNFIRECLDSILSQDVDFEYEILIGEDGSIDGTREICISYTEKYPDKIRLLLHNRSNNITIGGQPTGRFNFIYTLFSARGKYVAFCEGDDYWTDPLKLKSQVAMLEKEEAFGSCHPVRKHITRRGRDIYIDQPIEHNRIRYFLPDLLQPWPLANGSLIVRRDKIVVPEWLPTVASGDIALILSSIKDGYIVNYPKIAGTWRIHDGGVSVTHTGIKKVMDMAVLYDHINRMYEGRYRTQIYHALEQEVIRHVIRNRERELLDKVRKGGLLSAKEHMGAVINKFIRRITRLRS